MQKIYRLLRDNLETGPYDLDELLQLDLKPYDLVWAEGKTLSWQYPQEIESLKPHLSSSKTSPQTTVAIAPAKETRSTSNASSHKNIFVAIPSPRKKEEPVVTAPPVNKTVVNTTTAADTTSVINTTAVASPATSAAASSAPLQQPKQTKTQQTKPAVLQEIEIKASDCLKKLTDHQYQPKKTNYGKGLIIAGFLLACVGFVLWRFVFTHRSATAKEQIVASKNQVIANKQQESSTTPPVVSNAIVNNEQKVGDEPLPADTTHAALPNTLPATTPPQQNNTPLVNVPPQPKEQTQEKIVTQSNQIKEADKPKAVDTKKEQTTPIVPPTTAANQTTAMNTEEKITKEEKPAPPEVKENKPEIKENKPIATPPPKEEKHEEAKPVAENHVQVLPTNSESPLAKQLIVKFSMPENTTGIKNAKLTLINRNSESISKATVAILYYDDAKIPLDKKVVYIGKLNSWQSVTIPILDHAKATNLEYRIVSVSGNY